MEHSDRRFIVVSGMPASGKTAVARRLSTAFKLPLFDKDDILEALFEARLPNVSRRQLSRASDVVLTALVEQSRGAVVASFWRHSGVTGDSGTPCEWLGALLPRLVEVHCTCPPELAVARFLARERHTGHEDGEKTEAALLAQFRDEKRRGPLGVGHLIAVETSTPVDSGALTEKIRTVFDAVA